jgi:hypothetical protein
MNEQQTYDALIAERDSIRAKIAEAEALKPRLDELEDSNTWRDRKGLITYAKQALEDSKRPVYDKGRWAADTRRIVAIDAKWVTLSRDGSNNAPIRYKITNGWPERSRDGYGKIDVEKALAIWAEHND